MISRRPSLSTQPIDPALSRAYLSAVSSFGRLRQFISASHWIGRKSAEAYDGKCVYLEARKRFQDDVDQCFDSLTQEEPEAVEEALQTLVNMAQLLVRDLRWVNARTDTHSHIFLGSVLSERMVRLSLQEYIHPDARYGTPDEDRSPTKADVVVPLARGDMHLQVKMKWAGPADLRVQPDKKPMHVTVPMHRIRSVFIPEESRELASYCFAPAGCAGCLIDLEKLRWYNSSAFINFGLRRL